LAGQRVDNVEVADGQQLGFALGEPLPRRRTLALRTMAIAATIETDNGVRAAIVLATRDMAAERRGPAALDRRHHFQLAKAHMPCIGQTLSGTVVAEDVRDIQSWAGHETGATSPAAPP
jgi:hypothetical protein